MEKTQQSLHGRQPLAISSQQRTFFKTMMLGLVLASYLTLGDALVYNHFVPGFRFGRVEPELMTFPELIGAAPVRHMEWDLYVPGNILIILGHALATVNLQTNETSIIAGKVSQPGVNHGTGINSRFNFPFPFTQVNDTHLVLVDTNNHCLVMISRLTNQTSILVGDCLTQGFKNGPFGDSQFSLPIKIIKLQNSVFAVADGRNLCIREVDISTEQTYTLVNMTIVKIPLGLALRPGTKQLFFTITDAGLGYVDLDNKYVHFITETKFKGFRDGSLEQSIFDQFPETLIFLDTNTLLVTGRETHILRVVQLPRQSVSSVCDPRSDGNFSLAGDIESCAIRSPRSLLAYPSENKVLIGMDESIGYMTVESSSPESPTPFTWIPPPTPKPSISPVDETNLKTNKLSQSRGPSITTDKSTVAVTFNDDFLPTSDIEAPGCSSNFLVCFITPFTTLSVVLVVAVAAAAYCYKAKLQRKSPKKGNPSPLADTQNSYEQVPPTNARMEPLKSDGRPQELSITNIISENNYSSIALNSNEKRQPATQQPTPAKRVSVTHINQAYRPENFDSLDLYKGEDIVNLP